MPGPLRICTLGIVYTARLVTWSRCNVVRARRASFGRKFGVNIGIWKKPRRLSWLTAANENAHIEYHQHPEKCWRNRDGRAAPLPELLKKQ